MGCMIYLLNEQGWLTEDPTNSKDILSKHGTVITEWWERQLGRLNLSQSQPAALNWQSKNQRKREIAGWKYFLRVKQDKSICHRAVWGKTMDTDNCRVALECWPAKILINELGKWDTELDWVFKNSCFYSCSLSFVCQKHCPVIPIGIKKIQSHLLVKNAWFMESGIWSLVCRSVCECVRVCLSLQNSAFKGWSLTRNDWRGSRYKTML